MAIAIDQMQVFVKTDLGRRTIQHRSIELPRAARTILLLVDGRSTVAKLQQFIAATHASAETLHELESMGLIESIEPDHPLHSEAEESISTRTQMTEIERFNGLYELMCEVSATFLGLRGYFVQLKIERSANAGELLELRKDLIEAILNRHGAEVAKEISRRIKEFL
jgi:hypothetical protein